jgi:azurin/archaellum component FlaG (FlaF/FlaG flagellin family)
MTKLNSTAQQHSNTTTHSVGIDLAITNISIEPATVSVRENARITLEISNLGSVDMPKGKSPLVNIWIEGAGLKTAFVSRKLTESIAAGQTVKLTEGNNGPWNSPFGFSSEQGGEVTIKATIDADNQFVEAEEVKNNTLSQKFEVKKPATFSDFVLERAARSYASNAVADSVLSLIRLANYLGADSRVSVLKGIANGWNTKNKAVANETDKTLLVSIKNSLSDNLKTKFSNLAESFGLVTESNPDLQRIKIKSVKEMMQYDVKEFVVKAGKPVELTFENPDAMQHNLLVIKPKSLESIGKASDKMITQRDAAERNYIPNLPQFIIAATPLVNPNQSHTLTFTAPTEAGDYPFVCTFPGHWRLMKGVMKVVK